MNRLGHLKAWKGCPNALFGMSLFFRHAYSIQCFYNDFSLYSAFRTTITVQERSPFGALVQGQVDIFLTLSVFEVGMCSLVCQRPRSPALWMCQVLQAPAGASLWARCPALLSAQGCWVKEHAGGSWSEHISICTANVPKQLRSATELSTNGDLATSTLEFRRALLNRREHIPCKLS